MSSVVASPDTKTRGLLSEVGLPRVAVVAATVILAVAIQSTVLVQATILRVVPQLVLVVVAAFAYLDGERVGVVTGFFGGLFLDLLPPDSIVGLTALVYTLIGYLVGSTRYFAPSESVWSPVLIVALASTASEIGYAGLSIILGEEWVSLVFTAKVAGLVILYNTLLTPFVFPLVKRIANRVRPERVLRW